MPTAGIIIKKDEFIKRMRVRIGENIYGAIDALNHSEVDVNKMDAISCNAYLSACAIKINKTEFENLFDHFASAAEHVDLSAFFAALEDDSGGDEPVFYITSTTLAPQNTNTAHLALSGTTHIGFDAQFKPFPKHWGAPPNTQLKGHNGIMRPLPGGYGKGNAPMAKWVKMKMEADSISKTTVKGVKPYPFGNYSLGAH